MFRRLWLKIPKGKHTQRCAGWKFTSNKWVFFRAVPNWDVVNCRPQTSRTLPVTPTLTRIGCVCRVCVVNGTGRQSETLISRWTVEEIAEKLLVDCSLSLSFTLFVSLSFSWSFALQESAFLLQGKNLLRSLWISFQSHRVLPLFARIA